MTRTLFHEPAVKGFLAGPDLSHGDVRISSLLNDMDLNTAGQFAREPGCPSDGIPQNNLRAGPRGFCQAQPDFPFEFLQVVP